jgi:pimeloyl-ACP methyl ester carboxylesterase
MDKLWLRPAGSAVYSCTVLILLVFVLVVPYLLSLGQDEAAMPPHDLVGEHGRFVDIDGAAIYIEERNPESTRESIVFLHGFGGSTFSWRHNVPFFADRGYRVISLDLKGFGLSHKDAESDYSHPAQAGLVAQVLAMLDVDRAHLVGHSMGSSVMIHFAHLYPQKVLSLISVAGAPNMEQRPALPAALLRLGPLRMAGEVFLARYISKDRGSRILESAYHKDMVTREILDGYYDRIVIGRWAGALLAMTRDMHKNTVSFPLEDMAFPTMILWGEHDTWIARPYIDRWKDRIPGAEFHVIPGTGHMLMEEDPELFNDMVLAFLESKQ